MRQHHVAGEKAFVDYSGKRIGIVDPSCLGTLLPYRSEREGQAKVGYEPFGKPSGKGRYLRILLKKSGCRCRQDHRVIHRILLILQEKAAMMGVQETPARLFYDFCLDEHIPADHMLRGIDRHLDLADLRRSLKPFYSQMGRPSVDPELMMRILIVGYCMGIRSERRLCEEVHLNLAYRWFCRLGLDGKVPDHSTFSKNRHGRFRESDALRHLFESVVQRCMEEGLVGAEGFAVDASLFAADANKQRSVPSKDWKPEELKEAPFALRANISPRLTMRRSARPRPSRPSSSPDPIRRRSGPARTRATPSSPTPPTI